MIRYFDASALVKRYVRETGTVRVRRLLARERPATSRFTAVEISTALARRCRQGDLSPPARDRLTRAVQDDLRRLLLVELTEGVVRKAVEVLARHALRAGDSLQLGSALHLAERSGVPVCFVAFDERLNRAAEREGLSLLT